MSVNYKVELSEETLRKLAGLKDIQYSELTRSENSIRYALTEYIDRQYLIFTEEEAHKFVVGWVSDEIEDGKPMDRNEKGEITGFFEAAYHGSLDAAIYEAKMDFLNHPEHISGNREIIVAYGNDVGKAKIFKPLWSSKTDYDCQMEVLKLEVEKIKRDLYDTYEQECCKHSNTIHISFYKFIDSAYQDVKWLTKHLTAEQAVKLYEGDKEFPIDNWNTFLEDYVWADNNVVFVNGKLPHQRLRFEIVKAAKNKELTRD